VAGAFLKTTRNNNTMMDEDDHLSRSRLSHYFQFSPLNEPIIAASKKSHCQSHYNHLFIAYHRSSLIIILVL
jgi:hypothetical protein